MSSLADLAVVRIAIELCNNSELKKEILREPKSDYNSIQNFKEQWNKIIENKAVSMLESLCSIYQLMEKATGNVILIALRMLTWAEYHEEVFGLFRKFNIIFLNSSLFTSQGIIDNKKAAEELMKEQVLNIKQKYKLACFYCLTEHIPDVYEHVSQEELFEKQNLFWFFHPEIVRFWSYYLMGRIDELIGEKTRDVYMLETSVKSGSKAAVEYCLEETSLSRTKGAVIDAALQAVRAKPPGRSLDNSFVFHRIGYLQGRYVSSNWFPFDYFVDILYFLLSKMREDQKIEFIKKDIEAANLEEDNFYDYKPSRVLSYLLDWPYQNYFMQTAQLMGEFLSKRMFADLLLKICYKIISRIISVSYAEERTYDYRKLLGEFWRQSPDHYKRYMFSDKEITFQNGAKYTLNEGKSLLVNLFAINNPTYSDMKNIELILDSTTDEDKESIILSKEGKIIATCLIEQERWRTLDEFVSNFLRSKEQAVKYKRDLSISKYAEEVCIDFIRNQKWDAVELFMKWSSLSEEEIIRLKRRVIYSEDGKNACAELYLHNDADIANKFCEWVFSSEEEIRKFKKELIFSLGVPICTDSIIKDKLNVVDESISCCLFSLEEIAEFKKHLHYERGNYICEELISGGLRSRLFEGGFEFRNTIEFQGGKWEQIEKYLTWCFSSEEEIREFKKGKLLKESGKKIHYNLIEPNQWEEAEIFFAWLGLSPKEIKELKKETLFNYAEANLMFHKLICTREGDSRFKTLGFSDYGSRQEGIELLLRWYLTDEVTLLEFRDHFKQKYENKELSEEDRAALKDFDSAVEQCLRDLDEEQRGTKRKHEMSEDLCDVELKESTRAEYEK